MTSSAHPLFSPQDLETIRQATARAERRTSGEVVSYSVERCDSYPEARWMAAAAGALLACLVAGAIHLGGGFWGWNSLWLVLPTLLGFSVGFLLGQIAGCQRWLLSGEIVERRVRLRAESAFLEEEIFKTRDRTGILIFLALFERRVVILADEGIHRRVGQDEWLTISDALAAGIRQGRAAAALIEAIDACGRLLEERRVERRPDDVDELTNELRIRDE